MAEYYLVLKKAVAGLGTNTTEARRTVYERARTALIGQLKAINPPMSNSEISRQRLELEEAIRRVERETTSLSATAFPAAGAAETARSATTPRSTMQAEIEDAEEEPDPEPAKGADDINRASAAALQAIQQSSESGLRESPLRNTILARSAARNEAAGRNFSPEPQAAEADAEAYRPGRGADVEGVDFRPGGYSRDDADPPTDRPAVARTVPRPPRERSADSRVELDDDEKRGWLKPVLLVLLLVLVCGGIGAFGWMQRDRIMALLPSFGGAPAAPDSGSTVVDKVPEPAAPPRPAAAAGDAGTVRSATTAPLPVGQKAFLYEENPSREGEIIATLQGAATWSFVEGGADGPSVKADIVVPERGLTVRITLRRNTDSSLPAALLFDIAIETQGRFLGGGVEAIPRIILKTAEQERGEPVAGVPVKVTDKVFWFATSNQQREAQANLTLLRERNWIDLPLLYTSRQRAILTFEKGSPGEQAMQQAVAAWGR